MLGLHILKVNSTPTEMMRHNSVANLLRGGNDSDDEFVEITVKRVNSSGNAVIQMEGNILGGTYLDFQMRAFSLSLCPDYFAQRTKLYGN